MPISREASLISTLKKKNISGFYFKAKEEAQAKILGLIPLSATVGISGSVTLDQLGIVRQLEKRGSQVFNQYKQGLSREENLELRRKGSQADFYLTSANAISETGEMVFFSGFGNRTAGIAYAPNLLVVCGVNKIVPDLQAALKRAREYATPLNCKRLNWKETPCFEDGICREKICLYPEYKRMCCQVLIIESEISVDRIKVVLIGENLGF